MVMQTVHLGFPANLISFYSEVIFVYVIIMRHSKDSQNFTVRLVVNLCNGGISHSQLSCHVFNK